MSAEIRIILTSVDDRRAAERLATEMVSARLAACAHISGPGRSVYRWQGGVETSEEYYLSLKTHAPAVDAACAWLQRHHPYEVPEIVVLAAGAADAYAAWLQAEVVTPS